MEEILSWLFTLPPSLAVSIASFVAVASICTALPERWTGGVASLPMILSAQFLFTGVCAVVAVFMFMEYARGMASLGGTIGPHYWNGLHAVLYGGYFVVGAVAPFIAGRRFRKTLCVVAHLSPLLSSILMRGMDMVVPLLWSLPSFVLLAPAWRRIVEKRQPNQALQTTPMARSEI